MTSGRVGQDVESKILRVIRGLRKSKSRAGQAEIAKRAQVPLKITRQVLRRLRRQGKVKVSIENGKGKRMVRIYS